MGRKSRSRRKKEKTQPQKPAVEAAVVEPAAAQSAVADPIAESPIPEPVVVEPAPPVAAESATPEPAPPQPSLTASPLLQPTAEITVASATPLPAPHAVDSPAVVESLPLRAARRAYEHLPTRQELARGTRELVFGADSECTSLTGPARPVMRLLAALYDLALLSLFNSLVFAAALLLAARRFAEPLVEGDPNAFLPAEAKNYFLTALAISSGVSWLYLTLPEALPFRATLGKKLCSLQTVDIHGGRVSFFRSNLRLIAKIATLGTFGLGYILSVTRKDRRALHDVMAKTQVVREG